MLMWYLPRSIELYKKLPFSGLCNLRRGEPKTKIAFLKGITLDCMANIDAGRDAYYGFLPSTKAL